MLYEMLNCQTKEIKFVADIDCPENSLTALKKRLGVIYAINNNISLNETDLIGADLSNIDFRGIDLRGANMICADVTGANFRGSYFKGATMSASWVEAQAKEREERVYQKWIRPIENERVENGIFK